MVAIPGFILMRGFSWLRKSGSHIYHHIIAYESTFNEYKRLRRLIASSDSDAALDHTIITDFITTIIYWLGLNV